MEMSVKVMSANIIRPATYQPSHVPQRIDLTTWDVIFLLTGPNQNGLLFDSNLTPESLQLLQDSLSRTLDFFYPLAGRLGSVQNVSKNSTLFYIECNNAGVEFTHVVANGITMSDILQPEYNHSMMKLLFPDRNEHQKVNCDPRKPFLAVQVTELTNGGYFLTVSMSHYFGDGCSFWHFVNSWAEICRGCDSLSHPPDLARRYPNQSEIWIPNESISPNTITYQTSKPLYKERIFILTKETITLLKLKAIEATKNPKISSFQAILGFLYTFIARSRRIHSEDSSVLFVPVDVRTRLNPQLSSYYLGNAVMNDILSMSDEDLNANDAIITAISKVHDLVCSQTETSAMSYLSSSIKKPLIFRQEETITNNVNNNKNNVIVASFSPRFDVYGNDFGWGRPTAVRGGGVKSDGVITFYEGAESGSIQVDIFLLAKTFEILEKDTEFTSVFRI